VNEEEEGLEFIIHSSIDIYDLRGSINWVTAIKKIKKTIFSIFALQFCCVFLYFLYYIMVKVYSNVSKNLKEEKHVYCIDVLINPLSLKL
jgi:hypothetical protein